MFFSGTEQNFAGGGQQTPETGPKQQNRAWIQNCPPGPCTGWGQDGGRDLLHDQSIKALAQFRQSQRVFEAPEESQAST